MLDQGGELGMLDGSDLLACRRSGCENRIDRWPTSVQSRWIGDEIKERIELMIAR